MDCDEIQVVVESSEGCANVIALEVRAGWRQQVRTKLHLVSECGPFDAEPDGGHLCCSLDRVDHVVAPAVHSLLPLRECSGDDLGQVIVHLFRALTDRPEEAPLGIELRRELRQWFVLLWETVGEGLVIAGLLDRLVGSARLVA